MEKNEYEVNKELKADKYFKEESVSHQTVRIAIIQEVRNDWKLICKFSATMFRFIWIINLVIVQPDF